MKHSTVPGRVLVLLALCIPLRLAAAPLEPGAKAPPFLLQGSDGKTYTLAQFTGGDGRGVVLAWFPKAFTPGCTEELTGLRDDAALLAAYATPVYMVSLDLPERNRAFAESLGADVVLLSDPDATVARAYGVLAGGGTYAQRWTFYVDRDGVIRAIDRDVNVGSAAADVARTLDALGFPKRPAPEETGEPEAR